MADNGSKGSDVMKIELEKKKLALAVTKARAAKEEIEMKILERQLDIERMRDHSRLQDDVIKQAEDKLAEL